MHGLARGDVWLADLNPTRGHEQAGTRPCLVISADLFNQGPSELVVIVPLTTKAKNIPFHVKVDPPEGGVRIASYIKCEDIRAISTDRLLQRWGSLSSSTLLAVEDRLRILLSL